MPFNRRPSVDVDLENSSFDLAINVTGEIWFNHAATLYLAGKHPSVCRAYCEITWKSRTDSLDVSNEDELKRCLASEHRFLAVFLTFHYTRTNDKQLLGHSNAIICRQKEQDR